MLLDKEGNSIANDYIINKMKTLSMLKLNLICVNALNKVENNLPLEEKARYDKEVNIISKVDFKMYVNILKPFLHFYIMYFNSMKSFDYIINKIKTYINKYQ
jgi:hypothetical protein